MSERQSHKSISKRLGIQTVINKNQDIFVFSNNQSKTESLQLSDQQQQLIEQHNDLASIKSDLRYGNVKFGLLDGGLQANLERYQQYSKDLTYQLNLLFAYNYARYKDLSDELIFNRKY